MPITGTIGRGRNVRGPGKTTRIGMHIGREISKPTASERSSNSEIGGGVWRVKARAQIRNR
jgi:hypothetical protein